MAGPRKHTAEQVIKAIAGSGGVKATIARRLGVHRNSINNFLEYWTSVKQAYDDEVETVGDMAESVIMEDIVKNKSVETAKWYATWKLANRGYSKRSEFTGADGGPMQVESSVTIYIPDNGRD